jgi:hypothetical protein
VLVHFAILALEGIRTLYDACTRLPLCFANVDAAEAR